MDAFLIILVLAFVVILLLANFYILVIYIHPDEKGIGRGIISKILIVNSNLIQFCGLTLSWAQVLMLPLDVGNSRFFLITYSEVKEEDSI